MAKFIFRKGLNYVCTFSASPAYKEGSVYTCYLNSKGEMCLKGDDGIEDLTKNIVSAFKESKDCPTSYISPVPS